MLFLEHCFMPQWIGTTYWLLSKYVYKMDAKILHGMESVFAWSYKCYELYVLEIYKFFWNTLRLLGK